MGAIIGIAVGGGVLLVAALAIAVYFLHFRKKTDIKKAVSSGANVTSNPVAAQPKSVAAQAKSFR